MVNFIRIYERRIITSIDTTFNMQTDARGRDPDSTSPTFKKISPVSLE